MAFELTPEEAQRPAKILLQHLRKRHFEVKTDKNPWPDVPYRTSMFGTHAGLTVLVEAQGILSYGATLKGLATWLGAKRHYAQFYIATTTEATLQAGMLAELKSDGVGLFIVDDDGAVREAHGARNAALVVTPDPTLTFGSYKAEVLGAVRKFNDTDRKDGLRDMCELVERATEELGVAACRKKWLKIPEPDFRKKDWSDQINELSRPEAYNVGHALLVSPTFKNDLHSFRGARNLVDHPVKGRRESKARQKQFAERMMQGPRLVSELLAVRRKVK